MLGGHRLNRKPPLRYAVLVASLLLAGLPRAAHAAAPVPAEALAWLNADRFNELDRRYAEIQRGYRQGSVSDEELRAAFRVFYATDVGLEPKYRTWAQQWPQSYVAHLARAIYYKKVGQERRGGNFMAETTATQIQGMEAAFEVASEELLKSYSLDDKPLLSYLHAIDISNSLGQADESRRLFDLAVKIDPRNFIVREKYMGTLQTRWGGSVEQMRDFLQECRQAQLSAAHLKALEALVIEDEGWVHQYREGNPEAAVRSFMLAAKK